MIGVDQAFTKIGSNFKLISSSLADFCVHACKVPWAQILVKAHQGGKKT